MSYRQPLSFLSRRVIVSSAFLLGSLATAWSAPSIYEVKKDPFVFGSVKIGGGGWVSGLERSPTGEVYAQTDVGGVYRLDNKRDTLRWISVTDRFWSYQQQPVAIVFDPRPERSKMVYVTYGPVSDPNNNGILISSDNGRNFANYSVSSTETDPATRLDMSGNGAMKNTGPKLAVNRAGTFLIAAGGLFTSSDPTTQTVWQRNTALDALTGTGKQLTFVQIGMVDGTEHLVVGVQGPHAVGKTGIFRSTDGGKQWSELAAPTYQTADLLNFPAQGNLTASQLVDSLHTKIYGYRAKFSSNGTLYVTLQAASPFLGAVWKLEPKSNTFADVTPLNTEYTGYKRYKKFHRFGGLEVLSGATPGQDTVLVSTADQTGPQRRVEGGAPGGENIYQSISGGAIWRPQFADQDANGWNIGCNFTSCLEGNPQIKSWAEGSGKIHKSGNLIVDPYDRKRLFIGSGDGIWSTADAHFEGTFTPALPRQEQDPARAAYNSRWRFESYRVEELVMLDFQFGDKNRKLNLGFDYGMFYWDDTNQWSNRVREGAGFNSDLDVAADKRWLQMRYAGDQLLLSRDNALSWSAVDYPQYALSEQAGATRVATSVDEIAFTKDGGRVFIQTSGRWYRKSSKNTDSVFFTKGDWRYADLETSLSPSWKTVSLPTSLSDYTGEIKAGAIQFTVDLGDANMVYGFHRTSGALLRSTDRGQSFTQMSIAGRMVGDGANMFYTTLSKLGFATKSVFAGGMATSPLVAVPGRTGELWICFNDYLQGNNGGVAGGLWKISGAHSEGLKDLQLSWKGSVATKYDIRGRRWKGLYGAVIAFGAPRKAGDYPALYAYGAGLLTEFDGENKVYASYNGFLRSDDSANNWVDISDPEGRKFGGLGNSGKIYPSPTVYGEIYHGTPGRGVVYAFTPEVATTQLGASPSRHTPPIGLQAQVRHGFLSIRIPSSLESSSQNLQVRLTNAQGKSRILALPAISQGDTEQQFLVSKLGLQGILSVQLLRNQQIVATTKTIVF